MFSVNDPDNAMCMTKSSRKEVLSKNYNKLLTESFLNHPSTKLIASIAKSSFWDLALDKGVVYHRSRLGPERGSNSQCMTNSLE